MVEGEGWEELVGLKAADAGLTVLCRVSDILVRWPRVCETVLLIDDRLVQLIVHYGRARDGLHEPDRGRNVSLDDRWV